MNVPRFLWICPAILGVIWAAGLSLASAGEAGHSFRFDPASVRIERADGWDRVRYGGLDLTHQVGAPALPVRIVHLAVPAGRRAVGVEVTVDEWTDLPGHHRPEPVPPPTPLSRPEVETAAPDPAVYAADGPFPADAARFLHQGILAGQGVAAVAVYPIQWHPAEGRLVLNELLTVRLVTREDRAAGVDGFSTAIPGSPARRVLDGLVVNPGDLDRPSGGPAPRRRTQLPAGTHRYLIITSEAFEPSFEPLADWKRKKGLSATIVTLEWIGDQYAGRDGAESVRMFIRDAHAEWGTDWVLLGGDTDVVPHRTAFAMDCEYGRYENNSIPCDLYFSDLDGDWDADGDGIFGEVEDEVDLYPEVFVGRAPVETVEEAEVFVGKVLTYERRPPSEYLAEMLFLAEVLWHDPYTDSGLSKNLIADRYVPRFFKPITKLYESLGNESAAAATAALNAGAHLINHDGHAGSNIMSVGSGSLWISTMDALTNAPMYGIFFSIGCWPAAFDKDCVAEHFVTAPGGGGVAFIGNSRYGWGSPGNPEYGYSDRYDQEFFKQLLKTGHHRVGEALAAAKSVYVPLSAQANVYRWCQYTVNLLGDPEMPVWTETPARLSVSHPHEVPADADAVGVRVSAGAGPVAGATVCLMQDEGLYAVAETGPDGEAQLTLDGADPARPVEVTVTAQNALPSESTFALVADGPFVVVEIDDPDGPPVLVTPGETVSLDLAFRNTGNALADEVWARVSGPGGAVWELTVGDIDGGGRVTVPDAISLDVPADLADGETLTLAADVVAAGEGNLWERSLTLTGATPVLAVDGYAVIGPTGTTGVIGPGDPVTVRMTLTNTGLAAADGVTATLSPLDDRLTVAGSSVDVEPLTPGRSRTIDLSASVAEDCPVPAFPELVIGWELPDGPPLSVSAVVPVGETGFADDLEGGPAAWHHEGPGDGWHLSSRRRHSGEVSWYCGDEATGTYAHLADGVLETGPFPVGRDANLSFWSWYELPNYGTDGFYVEVDGGDGWEVLDFIGSGGALGTLTTGNDWLPYEYDLSAYPPGTGLRVRFRFVSDDADSAEGVYIDDIRVSPIRREPDLAMAVAALRAVTDGFVPAPVDLDGDGVTGVADAVVALQRVAGVR